MIVSHTLRFVYVGPPKTGSTSMHVWLRQPALFDPRRDIDTTHLPAGQHEHRIPNNAAGYLVLASTRARDAWLDSLWRQSRNDSVDYDDRPLLSWPEFLRWRETCQDGFYRRELEEYYPAVVDYWIRCEQMTEDVERLPFVAPLARMLRPVMEHNRNKRCPRGFYKETTHV